MRKTVWRMLMSLNIALLCLPLTLAQAAESQNIEPDSNAARIVIHVKKDANADAFERQVKVLGGQIVRKATATSYVIALPQENLSARRKALKQAAAVATLEDDYPISIASQQVGWNVDRVAAPAVWPKTTGANVKVAVLDTGIDAEHPDLKGSVIGSANFTASRYPATVDRNGHGTHVAGIIAAHNNTEGTVGAAYNAQLLVAKVLNDFGNGYLSDVAAGINWAVSQHAQVINLSIGTTYNASVLRDAVAAAEASGVIVVAAAGNNYGRALTYPAAYAGVVSVGATDQNNKLARFSAVGATVVAPGVSVLSTYPKGRYRYMSGTSMATPLVVASLALLIAGGNPNPVSRLENTAVDLGTPGKDLQYGNGLISLSAALP